MTDFYRVSSDGKSLVPTSAGAGLPILRLVNVPRTGRGSAFSVTLLASAFNRKLTLSASAKTDLSFYGSEGIEIAFGNSRSTGLAATGGSAFAVATYRGYDSASGLFQNSAAPFEIRMLVNVDKMNFDEGAYDFLTSATIHDGVNHPRFGRHSWDTRTRLGVPTLQQMLRDQSYQRQFTQEIEYGNYSQATRNSSIAAYRGKVVIAESGVASLTARLGVSPAQAGAGGYFQGINGTRAVEIVSDADYRVIASELQVQSVAAASRISARRGDRPPSRIDLVSPNGQLVVATLTTETNPAPAGIALTQIVGSSLSAYLFADNPLAEIAGSALINAVGRNLQETFANNGLNFDVVELLADGSSNNLKGNILDDFGADFAQAFQTAAIGSFSSFLALELGSVLICTES